MVRHTLNNLTKVSGAVVAAFMLTAPAFITNFNASAIVTCVTNDKVRVCNCNGETTEDGKCAANSTFSVSVSELLTVSLTEPDNWATGNVDTFLMNKVSLTVASNSDSGYEAMMNSKDTTNLVNGSYTIPTVSSGTVGNNLSDQWGYNLPASSSTTVDGTSTFNAMKTSAIKLLGSDTPGSTTQDIYFGAKATSATASGTYSNTVIVSVVSGVNDNTPVIPSNPTTPTTDNNNPGGTAATETVGGNTYTVYTNDYNTTTYSEISSGNNVNAYSGYTAPQGEVNTVASINEGTPLATGLAVTAAVAATAGIVFFIIAKRRSDEDEEEDY